MHKSKSMCRNMEECKRPSWDRYFLDLCEAVSKRATCDRGRSGCVIVKDKRILATGYVGSPARLPHCDEIGHDMRKVFDDAGNVTQHCVRTLHGEQNAIIQAAKFGVSIDGATLYCKMVPCRSCAMMIINSGIKCVVAEKHYHAEADAVKMFKDARIKLVITSDEVEKYDRQ
ncbi:MAG: cytidine/deoxycytidylate deaminase family protein [Candidatus Bathyarchaeota archaeon]|nr:cytidine/deoxycytidylate deaminase family protein [Candidatus Bathyarchaeota archaeon]